MSKRVPNGTYYLSGIMDDAPNTEIPDIYAGVGDLVVFGHAAPGCVEVIVADGDVTGVGVDFNFVMPFALPIDPDNPMQQTIQTIQTIRLRTTALPTRFQAP